MFGLSGHGDGDLLGFTREYYASRNDDVDLDGDDLNDGACSRLCDYGDRYGDGEQPDPKYDLYVKRRIGA